MTGLIILPNKKKVVDSSDTFTSKSNPQMNAPTTQKSWDYLSDGAPYETSYGLLLNPDDTS